MVAGEEAETAPDESPGEPFPPPPHPVLAHPVLAHPVLAHPVLPKPVRRDVSRAKSMLPSCSRVTSFTQLSVEVGTGAEVGPMVAGEFFVERRG